MKSHLMDLEGHFTVNILNYLIYYIFYKYIFLFVFVCKWKGLYDDRHHALGFAFSACL